MSEIEFPEVQGETQETMKRFWVQVRDRMHSEHPELLEKHLPILEDTNPWGRLYASTALHAIMDVIDARARAEAAHKVFDQFENDHRKLA